MGANDADDHREQSVRRARVLRRSATHAEVLLWRYLRGGRLGGLRFRRQHPVGRYIVDFCCIERKLVVEVDGLSHEERDAYDAARTADLVARGFRVVRFLNDDVLRDTEGVAMAIAKECGVRLDT